MLCGNAFTFVAAAHIGVVRDSELRRGIKRVLLARVERKRLLDLFGAVRSHKFVLFRVAARGIAKLSFRILCRIEFGVIFEVDVGGKIIEAVVIRRAFGRSVALVNGNTAFPVRVHGAEPVRIHYVIVILGGRVKYSACAAATIVDVGNVGDVVVHEFYVSDVFVDNVAVFGVRLEIEVEVKEIVNRVKNARIGSAQKINRVVFGDYSYAVRFKRIEIDRKTARFVQTRFSERNILVFRRVRKICARNDVERYARSLFEQIYEFVSRVVYFGGYVFGQSDFVAGRAVPYDVIFRFGIRKIVNFVRLFFRFVILSARGKRGETEYRGKQNA